MYKNMHIDRTISKQAPAIAPIMDPIIAPCVTVFSPLLLLVDWDDHGGDVGCIDVGREVGFDVGDDGLEAIK